MQLYLIQLATDSVCFMLLGKIENPLWQLFDTRDIDHDAFSEACETLKKSCFPNSKSIRTTVSVGAERSLI